MNRVRRQICQNLCRYYKPEKAGQEEGCGPVQTLETRVDLLPALSALDPDGPALFGLDADHPALLAACAACPYRVDGCDFRDQAVPPEDCSPCGGLRALAGLNAAGVEI